MGRSDEVRAVRSGRSSMNTGGQGLPTRQLRQPSGSNGTAAPAGTVIDRLPEAAMVIFDAELRVETLCGVGGEDLRGIGPGGTPNSATGLHARDLFDSPDRPGVMASLRQAAAGALVTAEVRTVSAGATMALDAIPLRGGRMPRVLATTRNFSCQRGGSTEGRLSDRPAGMVAMVCGRDMIVRLAGGTAAAGEIDLDAAIGSKVVDVAAASGLCQLPPLVMQRAIIGRRHTSFEIVPTAPAGPGVLVDVVPLDSDGPGEQTLVVVRSLAAAPHSGWGLGHSDVRWRAAFDSAPIGMAEVTPAGMVVKANEALGELAGYPAAAIEGSLVTRGLHPDDMDEVLELLDQVGGEMGIVTDEVRILRPDGTLRWVVIRARELTRRPESQRANLLLHVMDVTDEHESTRRLAEAHARFDALVEHGTDVILVLDDAACVRYASPAAAGTFGVGEDELLETPADWWLVPDDRSKAQEAFVDLLSRPGGFTTFEVTAAHPDGRTISLEVTLSNRRDDPAVRGMVCNCRDVSDRVEAAARLVYQATHDGLTGLPNRTLLLDRLELALARPRPSGHRCAVLLLDLDNFKRVNDSCGHAAGDTVLVTAARRLANAVRPGDVVARLGGDEFAVLAEDIDDEDAVLVLADRLRAVLGSPIELPGRTVSVGVSIGVALGPSGLDHSECIDHPHVMLSEADTALSQAKEGGRDGSAVYHEAMRSLAARRLDLEELLRAKLRDGGIRVAFQPIIDLRSGLVVGTEALCRMYDNHGGEVAPTEFIPVAEDSGLVVPLGSEVLDLALARQAAVDAAGLDAHMSVNLSARQLAHPGIVSRVARALGASGVAPDRLVLELTESVLIDGGAQTRRSIEELDAMGVRLALDDFGTGWSSLSYLGRFPIHSLKIDRSFVISLGRPGGQQAIAEAIIGLARALRLVTVAEGVETEAQAEQLRRLGCDYAQGFLYSQPVSAEDLEASELHWRSC